MTALVRTWRATVAGVLCAGLAAVLAACGSPDPDEGTNGMGKLPAEAIEEKARAAAQSADAVRLSGSVITEGRAFRLDMRLGPEGGIGEVSTQGTTFELLRVGEDLYLKADSAFWQDQRPGDADEEETDPDSDPAAKLQGMYVKVAPEDPAYEQLSGFTDKGVLLDGLLTMEGERETGERGEIGGVRTIRVEAGGGAGGVMEVSLIGTPYPLRLQRGGEAGELLLNDWNKEFSVRAPQDEQIVDYGDRILRIDED
ncbi:hypothetical protein GCM10009716_12890 [Streptomyces sodiiphilus]|uniref:Lipoprotein n=1 Tax=Streptomyces sodiiphilus TaxID=226217 RepID=A0ABN2NXB2_9ACTN